VGFLAPDSVPSSGTLMLIGFFITLFGGLPIGFALALAALIFIWVEGTLPGVIFAQQMARGIDNFVLLAIPFFILVGYLMEANGMSVRLIELLQRAVGRMRGGLNVVMVMSMVLFSGISGSKMADVAAVGSVLIPAARRSKQNPGGAVALAGGFRGHGGSHPALHQSHHPRLRRQSVDRRIVRRGPAARRA
jgi:TRAP-type mannitol/chloroaromatic compound transport system permease large subunit